MKWKKSIPSQYTIPCSSISFYITGIIHPWDIHFHTRINLNAEMRKLKLWWWLCTFARHAMEIERVKYLDSLELQTPRRGNCKRLGGWPPSVCLRDFSRISNRHGSARFVDGYSRSLNSSIARSPALNGCRSINFPSLSKRGHGKIILKQFFIRFITLHSIHW